MEYEVLYANDNGTVKVKMTIGDRVLEQDFEAENLDENVKQGMAIFQSELKNNSPVEVSENIIGQVVQVKKSELPTIEE